MEKKRMCRASMECSNGFKAKLAYDGTESGLWEAVAKNLVNCPAPNSIYIERGKHSAELMAVETKWGTDYKAVRNDIPAVKGKYDIKHLTYVDVEENAYWFEKVIPHNMGTITIDVGRSYGRIGAEEGTTDAERFAKRPMPSFMFWPHYYSLLNAGFDDVTDEIFDDGDPYADVFNLVDEEKRREAASATINSEDDDEAVVALRDEMYGFSRQEVEQTVQVDFKAGVKLPFTRRQVASALKIINSLSSAQDVSSFNKEMDRLLALVPRRVNSRKGETLAKYYAKKFDDANDQATEFLRVINRELGLVMAMKAVLDMMSPEKKTGDEETDGAPKAKKRSLFGGTEVTVASKEERDAVFKRLGAENGVTLDAKKGILTTSIYGRTDRLKLTVYKLYSEERSAKFEKRNAERGITETKELYHGFKTAAGLSLISCGGPTTEFSASCGMYSTGPALYFALNFVKSFGYLSFQSSIWTGGESCDVGYMGIFEVAYGKDWNPPSCGRYTQATLDENGQADCIHARAGNSGLKMDEIIVFHNDAVRPKYLLRMEHI